MEGGRSAFSVSVGTRVCYEISTRQVGLERAVARRGAQAASRVVRVEDVRARGGRERREVAGLVERVPHLVAATQVISSAIVGAGSAEGVQKVRWNVAGQIVIAWLLTIPATGFLGGGVYWLLNKFIP